MKEDLSKRAFFKKAATAVGVVAAANYATTLISASSGSPREMREKYARDARSQESAWTQQGLTLMSEAEKKQMLDVILESHRDTPA